jgi:hypothetical protein
VQATTTDVINQVFDATSPQPEWQGQLNETHAFSGRAVNQFIAAFQWSGILFGPSNPDATLAVFPTELKFSGGSFNTLSQNQGHPVGRHITQYQIVDDFSIRYGKPHAETWRRFSAGRPERVLLWQRHSGRGHDVSR